MDANHLIDELQRTADANVFVMMRYRPAVQFQQIEAAIRSALSEFGLVARFAKDRALVEDLWENLKLYMQFSRYGIAVFEEIDEREFNPNISLELGYMYAHHRRCLLLKDRRIERIPTDICGRIYRDIDTFDVHRSVFEQVTAWCHRDLGLSRAASAVHEPPGGHVVVLDNAVEDPMFRTWGVFSTVRAFPEHIRVQPEAAGSPIIRLIANGNESVGVNKAFKQMFGRIRVEYQAVQSGAVNPNLLFCMIPMQDATELLEVGARVPAEPANAYSPYRHRYFVPQADIGDQQWHWAEIDFDFRKTPTAAYSIFAPRVNEGCPRPGSGELMIRNVRLFAPLGSGFGETHPAPST